MNKANVFLLVVVSSLLTYISTATQPAATAGVAQERWEYGKSSYENVNGNKRFFFDTMLGWGADWPQASVFIGNSENSKIEIFRLGTEDPLLHFVEMEPGFNKFPEQCTKLWKELGENGWYPYKVIPADTGPLNYQYQDTVYWRRRVQ